MEQQLWRLAWALPLVLVIGVVLIAWLKRLGVGTGQPASSGEPARVLSTTRLSEHTQLLVVEVERERLVIIESTVNIAVHERQGQTGQAVSWRRTP